MRFVSACRCAACRCDAEKSLVQRGSIVDFRRRRKRINPVAAGLLAACFSVLLILGLWISPVSFSPLSASAEVPYTAAPAPVQEAPIASQIMPVFYKTHITGAGLLHELQQETAPSRDITLRLYADGKEIRQLHLKAAGRLWNFDFGEYETYYAGVPIRYTLRTDPVEDYVVQIAPSQDGGVLRFDLTATPSQIVRRSRNLAAIAAGDDSRMLLWGAVCAVSILLLAVFFSLYRFRGFRDRRF